MLARNQNRLTMVLPSDREIVVTRVFNAPRRLVFEAWTRPEHVRRWYGCGAYSLETCEIDLREGGTWRYTLRASDGITLTMQGAYREILPPSRLVYTEQYVTPGFTTGEALVTVLFAEHDGMTTLTISILHASKSDRDAHLATGMERGADATFDRLAAHLATMA